MSENIKITDLSVAGIQKASTIDWPDRLSAVVFLPGCDMRCLYCHNKELQQAIDFKMSIQDVLDILIPRQALINSVVISGGEPTLSPYIELLSSTLYSRGFQLGLNTNGNTPSVIDTLLSKGLLNRIALDIKTTPDKYNQELGLPDTFANIAESISIIQNYLTTHSGFSAEFRITADKRYISSVDVLENILKIIQNSNVHIALQQPTGTFSAPQSSKNIKEWSKYYNIIPRINKKH